MRIEMAKGQTTGGHSSENEEVLTAPLPSTNISSTSHTSENTSLRETNISDDFDQDFRNFRHKSNSNDENNNYNNSQNLSSQEQKNGKEYEGHEGNLEVKEEEMEVRNEDEGNEVENNENEIIGDDGNLKRKGVRSLSFDTPGGSNVKNGGMHAQMDNVQKDIDVEVEVEEKDADSVRAKASPVKRNSILKVSNQGVIMSSASTSSQKIRKVKFDTPEDRTKFKTIGVPSGNKDGFITPKGINNNALRGKSNLRKFNSENIPFQNSFASPFSDIIDISPETNTTSSSSDSSNFGKLNFTSFTTTPQTEEKRKERSSSFAAIPFPFFRRSKSRSDSLFTEKGSTSSKAKSKFAGSPTSSLNVVPQPMCKWRNHELPHLVDQKLEKLRKTSFFGTLSNKFISKHRQNLKKGEQISAFNWTSCEVCAWLELIGLEVYAPKFLLHGINGQTLLDLEEEHFTSPSNLNMQNPCHFHALRCALFHLVLGLEHSSLHNSVYGNITRTVAWLKLRGFEVLMATFQTNAVNGSVLFFTDFEYLCREIIKLESINKSEVLKESLRVCIEREIYLSKLPAPQVEMEMRLAESWNLAEVENWLKSVHVGHKIEDFRQHAVNGTMLLTLNYSFMQAMSLSEIMSIVLTKALLQLNHRNNQEKHKIKASKNKQKNNNKVKEEKPELLAEEKLFSLLTEKYTMMLESLGKFSENFNEEPTEFDNEYLQTEEVVRETSDANYENDVDDVDETEISVGNAGQCNRLSLN